MNGLASQPSAACYRLIGQRVAFTGRLASLTREEAGRLVSAFGGRTAANVTRSTTLLVIGEDGWPLLGDGRLSRKLRRARELEASGAAIEVIGEQAFLDRLGLEELGADVRRKHTLAQLSRLFHIPRDRLRWWIKCGLLRPVETIEGLALFDFHQAAAVKTLCELTEQGVGPMRLRRSLEQLRAWLPDAEEALARLSAVQGRLLVRDEQGELAEPTGQKLLEFDASEAEQPILGFHAPLSPDSLFERAVSCEEEGRFEEAARRYRQWLARFGPDAEVCFNLGNTLSALEERAAAVERFRQAVEVDAEYIEAWNNLGAALAQDGQPAEALAALRRALELDGCYADALYNLADTLDELGQEEEALDYWRAYLECDDGSQWADYARERLSGARA